jgi:hypothetical protein
MRGIHTLAQANNVIGGVDPCITQTTNILDRAFASIDYQFHVITQMLPDRPGKVGQALQPITLGGPQHHEISTTIIQFSCGCHYFLNGHHPWFC